MEGQSGHTRMQSSDIAGARQGPLADPEQRHRFTLESETSGIDSRLFTVRGFATTWAGKTLSLPPGLFHEPDADPRDRPSAR